MTKIKSFSAVSAIVITIVILILCVVSWAADSPPAPPADGGAPPGGGTPPGGIAATTELGSKYSLDILAPSGIPVKTVHIKDPTGKISATMDSEHGAQTLTNVSFDGKALKFTAVLGSDGNEKFDFTMKLYSGGILLGECEGGRGPSPVVMKAIE